MWGRPGPLLLLLLLLLGAAAGQEEATPAPTQPGPTELGPEHQQRALRTLARQLLLHITHSAAKGHEISDFAALVRALEHVIMEEESTWHFSARVHAHLQHASDFLLYPKGEAQSGRAELARACRAALAAYEAVLYPWAPRLGAPAAATRQPPLRGRGIVVLASNTYARMAAALLHSLRAIHQCRLPVVVYHLGEADLDAAYRTAWAQLPGVRVLDLRQQFPPGSVDLDGFAAKPFAILASGFAEAILVDADVMFFGPPASLFDAPGYLATGVLLFLDRNIIADGTKLPWVASMVGPGSSFLQTTRLFNGSTSHEVESGVVLYNVARNRAPLLATCRLNTLPERSAALWKTWGDKETFWVGFEVAQRPWAVSSGDVAGLGFCEGVLADYSTCFCDARLDAPALIGLDATAILHLAAGGEPIFLHFSKAKQVAYQQEPTLYVPGTHEPWAVDSRIRFCVWAPKERYRLVPEPLLARYRAHMELMGAVDRGNATQAAGNATSAAE